MQDKQVEGVWGCQETREKRERERERERAGYVFSATTQGHGWVKESQGPETGDWRLETARQKGLGERSFNLDV